MKSSKKAYSNKNVLGGIEAAIELLCAAYGECTPTDVLRIAKCDESNCMRSIVLEVAKMREYRIVSSGRGYKILDW